MLLAVATSTFCFHTGLWHLHELIGGPCGLADTSPNVQMVIDLPKYVLRGITLWYQDPLSWPL